MNESYTYIISYDVAEGGDYDALISHIKEYGTWAHITKSLWAIVSSKTASVIRDEIKEYLPQNSRLMVVRSANVAAWDNVLCSNDWLKKNI